MNRPRVAGLKIRGMTIALVLGCSLLPLIAGSFGFYATAKRALNELLNTELSSTTRSAMAQAEAWLEEAMVDLHSWSKLRIMQDALIDDAEREISGDLLQLRERYSHYDELVVTNGAGRVIAATRAANLGRDLSAHAAVVAAKGLGRFQGAVEYSELSDAAGITIAAPLQASYDKKVQIGALIGVISWERAAELIAQLSLADAEQDASHVYLLLARASGSLLYVTASARVIGGDIAGLLARVDTRNTGREISVGDKKFRFSIADSRGNGLFSDPQWRLIALVDMDAAFAGIGDFHRNLLLVICLASILAAAIGWFAANGLTRPISRLIGVMKKLAHGRHDLVVPARDRNDELGDMAKAIEVFRESVKAQARHQEQLAEAKAAAEAANQTKSQFLANMSHELRTPLNSIIGFSDLMVQEVGGPIGNPKYKQYATDILQSGTHLLGIINDILDVSKVEAGKFELNEEEIDVAQLVEDCLRMIKVRAEQAQLQLFVIAEEAMPEIRADRRVMKQVLINLLTNAIKFTPRAGEVRIGVDVENDGRFLLYVRDTGIGITPEQMTKLLKPFAQAATDLNRNVQGTGLGLYLTKGLVELHSGTLELTSTQGQGTTVAIRLPAERVTSSKIRSPSKENRVATTANGGTAGRSARA
jgi:signal transduction histidine kinase